MFRIRLRFIAALAILPIVSGFYELPPDPLMAEIMDEAPKKRMAPIDARIDRLEGAIPGYNGLEVDIDRTYQINKNNAPGSEIHYVFREIPPAVNLENLGAQPIYRGNPQKPMVALMINVAWGNEYIPKMLETLDKRNVKATFFFDGSWLKKNVPVARQIAEHGHELSNHAYSHKNMSQLSPHHAYTEILKTEKLLQDELHVQNRWFAPPSGDFNQKTVEIALSLKLNTILWTLDTVDWKKPSPDSIIRKIDAKAGNGFLILMHPTQSASTALDGMITTLQRKGLQIGTVTEVLSPNRVADNKKGSPQAP